MGDMAELASVGASVGVFVFAAVVTGFRWLSGQIRAAKGSQGADLIRALAADLRTITPPGGGEAQRGQAESPGTEILDALGRVVEDKVRKAQRPVLDRLRLLEGRVDLLAPAVAGVAHRQGEHSRRIADVEAGDSAVGEVPS